MSRDLRASLWEFLALDYGLTYKQSVEISEKFCDFLVNMSDSKITVKNTRGNKELYYALMDSWQKTE